MEFYKIRMVNNDEHITDVDPSNLTGDWAIIGTYKRLLGENWETLGFKKSHVVHIRPANIVSYTYFVDMEVKHERPPRADLGCRRARQHQAPGMRSQGVREDEGLHPGQSRMHGISDQALHAAQLEGSHVPRLRRQSRGDQGRQGTSGEVVVIVNMRERVMAAMDDGGWWSVPMLCKFLGTHQKSRIYAILDSELKWGDIEKGELVRTENNGLTRLWRRVNQ